jgi:8-oxo-dGTP diphosphatase
MKKERFKCRVAACLVLRQGDKVLLARRANTGFGDGFYALPGGNVDGNEPITHALVREIQEELGITIDPKDCTFISCLHVAPYFRTPDEILLFCFQAEKYKGIIENKEPEKCDDLQFFDIHSLPENMLEGSKQCLQNLISSSYFTELHWTS